MNTFDTMSELLKTKGCNVKRNESLKNYNTMKVGGTAEIVACPETKDCLADIIAELKNLEVKYIIIGNGSNVIFDDGHFNGVIIVLTGLDEITTDGNMIFAECGVSLNKLSVTAKNNSLSGLEFAYGIPGTAGGAVYMNAGAYGGQISDILTETEYIDTEDCIVKKISNEKHYFSHRNSIFQHKNFIILASSFMLSKGNISDIEEKMTNFMKLRKEKQPLEYPNSGSIFRRCSPFITSQLIDECGLKGKTVGGAMVSFKHSGFIINKGNASFNDVTKLIDIIKEEIFKKKGVHIECEVEIIKFDN